MLRHARRSVVRGAQVKRLDAFDTTSFRVKHLFVEIADVFRQACESEYIDQISAAAEVMIAALTRGSKILAFGNGGSAADAQHICGELVVRFKSNRKALPAIALTADSAVLTACSNDLSFQEVFSRQIEALGVPGDVALGISTSGNSTNVIAGLRAARKQGLSTLLFTGPGITKAGEFSDIVIAAPGSSTARIQELHLAAYHSVCELIDLAFSEGQE